MYCKITITRAVHCSKVHFNDMRYLTLQMYMWAVIYTFFTCSSENVSLNSETEIEY